MPGLADLAPKLKWDQSPATIKANKKAIDEVEAQLAGELKAVRAFHAANRDLCQHPNLRSWSCYNGYSSKCDDCGRST